MKDGFIEDFISGIQIKSTPEEVDSVQPFCKILVDDYGYPKENIVTHPQWRVKSNPSDTQKKYPLDIAVFSGKPADDKLYIIVECKQKTIQEGRSQLENYLTFSTAELGVWFNGSEAPLYIRKIVKSSGGVEFEEIPNIPRYGESIDAIGKFKKKDLKPAHNLKTIFKTIRCHLEGNVVGATQDTELAKQLINVIFTKIYDEKFTKKDDIVKFRAELHEKPEDIKKRIEELFNKVKTEYKEVIEFNDKIDFDSKSLYFIAGQLQNFSLLEAERDVIADAFEVFVGRTLKGAQGQFFTPRNVVRLMVTILDQKTNETIIDPACGSGGFIVEALRHIWKKLDDDAANYGWSKEHLTVEKIKKATTQIYGIERDSFLAKVAKAYMALLGDGKGGIFCEDSLKKPEEWKSKTKEKIKLGEFDSLLANPPFGKDITVSGEEKLKQYDLSYKFKSNKTKNVWEKTSHLHENRPPQILFIERSIQLLKDGGRLGIIIPETFLHAPKLRFVLQFMKEHNIYCIIDLPHNTFRPHNNAKCIAVFLEKNKPQTEKIMMCVAEEMGHNHQGSPIYRWNYDKDESTDEIWDDIQKIKEEIKSKSHTNYTFFVDKKTVEKSDVYVPRYFWKNKEKPIENSASKEGYNLVPINDLIQENVIHHFDGHGSPTSKNKGKGDIPYIRVKDIVNWEIYKDPTAKIPEKTFHKYWSAKKSLKPEDIVYVRRGSYRIGSVAMVSPLDEKVLLTREILVLRIMDKNNKYNLTPHYLLYALSHWITQEQAKNKILTETTLPNIAERWKELKIPIHKDASEIKKISECIREVINSKWDASAKIQKVSQKFGKITT